MKPANARTNRPLAGRAVAAGLAATLLASGCAEPLRLFEARLYAMGTWVDIAVLTSEDNATRLFDEAERLLRRFEIDYYAWADGELARINRELAANGEAVADPAMAALLREARRITIASEGAFDPAVGALVELWGFHSALTEPAPPRPEAIDAWLRGGASLAAVEIEGTMLRTDAAGVVLDLGGIAKGEAVDRLVALVGRHGIRDAIVNAGGDLRVLGRRGQRPWRIGIKDPRAESVLGVIELADGEAAFTSGDYERFVDRDGRRLHHILDPRTGFPAEATRAVTVIARRGVDADAAATALFVAGDEWRRIAPAVGVEAVLRVDAAGEIEATESMRRRLVSGNADEWDVVASS